MRICTGLYDGHISGSVPAAGIAGSSRRTVLEHKKAITAELQLDGYQNIIVHC